MPRKDGSGIIYRRKDNATGEEIGPWLVKIYVSGKPVYESSHSYEYAEAVKLRDKLLGKRASGQLSARGEPDKITIDKLLDDMLRYSTAREETKKIYRYTLDANIRPYFGKLRATKLTTDKLMAYREKRIKRDKVSDETVDRETSILRIAYRFGFKKDPPTVLRVPHFPMLKNGAVRQGFLEDAQYAKLRDELPPHLRPLFVVAYTTGCRKGELLRLRWEQVDFDGGYIELRAGETKSGAARSLPFLSDMRSYLESAKQDRDTNYPSCQWVFSRHGEPIKNFRETWTRACKRAGVPDLLFHDLRRTAVRNLRRADIPQAVRMKISGHKTTSMEIRYNIVDTNDLEDAKAKMASRATA